MLYMLDYDIAIDDVTGSTFPYQNVANELLNCGNTSVVDDLKSTSFNESVITSDPSVAFDNIGSSSLQ